MSGYYLYTDNGSECDMGWVAYVILIHNNILKYKIVNSNSLFSMHKGIYHTRYSFCL